MRLFYSKLINTWSSSESQRRSNVGTIRKLKCRHSLEQGRTNALCTFQRIMFVCSIKGQSTLLNLRRSRCSIIIFVAAARFLWLQTCGWCQWKPLVKGQVSHNAEEALRREQPRRQQRGGCEVEARWRREGRASPAGLALSWRGRAGCVKPSSRVSEVFQHLLHESQVCFMRLLHHSETLHADLNYEICSRQTHYYFKVGGGRHFQKQTEVKRSAVHLPGSLLTRRN